MYGIDISNWQKGANLSSAKSAGASFAIIKATEGVTYVDPYCDGFYQQAKKIGMLRGVYHFARGGNPYLEADYFVNNIKGYLNDCILVLDFEDPATSQGPNWAKNFLDRVYSKTNIRPLIYMNSATERQFDWSGVVGNYGLWLAGYPSNNTVGFNAPNMPYSIRNKWNLAIWQYSSSGSIAGIPGKCDVNIAYMDGNAWNKYASSKSPVTPAPVPTVNYPSLYKGVVNAYVGHWQSQMNKVFPAYSKLVVDNIFGNASISVAKEFQKRVGITPDGIVGADTWRHLTAYGVRP